MATSRLGARSCCSLAAALALFHTGAGAAEQSARALALLHGVEATRAKIPAGTFRIRFTAEFMNQGVSRTHDAEYDVDIDGDNRRYTAIKYDGRDKQLPVNIVRPDEMILFEGNPLNSVTVASKTHDTAALLFDLKATGLSELFKGDLQQCMAIRADATVVVVDEHWMGATRVTHVRISRPDGVAIDSWIEDLPGFPVPRHEVRFDNISHVTESTYELTDLPELPSATVTTSTRDGMKESVTRLEIRSFQPKSFDAATFSLAGMKLPVGIDVLDDRLKQRIGYWDGEKLTPQLPKSEAARAGDEQKGAFFNNWIIAINAGIIVLVIMWLIYRRRRASF